MLFVRSFHVYDSATIERRTDGNVVLNIFEYSHILTIKVTRRAIFIPLASRSYFYDGFQIVCRKHIIYKIIIIVVIITREIEIAYVNKTPVIENRRDTKTRVTRPTNTLVLFESGSETFGSLYGIDLRTRASESPTLVKGRKFSRCTNTRARTFINYDHRFRGDTFFVKTCLLIRLMAITGEKKKRNKNTYRYSLCGALLYTHAHTTE